MPTKGIRGYPEFYSRAGQTDTISKQSVVLSTISEWRYLPQCVGLDEYFPADK